VTEKNDADPASASAPSATHVGSFAEARRFRLELTLAASPSARLAWLEDAIRLAHRSGALPRPR
jgi:hypothetical protein